MTTYTLPVTAEIGDVLYYDGDLVWYNGVAWAPVVIGATKLNDLAVEVTQDEGLLVNDAATINSLQAQIDDLSEEVEALKSALDA
jgi:hypothetical protein